jgi:hypothetical protein
MGDWIMMGLELYKQVRLCVFMRGEVTRRPFAILDGMHHTR